MKQKIEPSLHPVIVALYISGKTCAAIGRVYGISRERVRQIVYIADATRPRSRPQRILKLSPEEKQRRYDERMARNVVMEAEMVLKNSWYAREVFSGRRDSQREVFKAIKNGVLIHPTQLNCADCDNKASEYEHRDYNHPLKVDPICRGCNARRAQAKPKEGFFGYMLAFGHPPYEYRLHMQRLAKIFGYEIKDIDKLPKRLTAEHWAKHWPEFQQ